MLVTQERDNYWMLNWLDKFMVGHKGFICGGCFKNIFSKEKVKDLDIFFESEEDWADAVDYFDSMTPGYEGDDKRIEKYYFSYQNPNVKAYKHQESGIRIELCRKIFGTAEQILNQFDFTITKFAYYKVEVEDETGAEVEFEFDPFELEPVLPEKKPETHIEYKVMMDDKFFEHLHLHRLVADNAIPYPMSTYDRMFKYAKYGFFPCKETKMKVIQAIHQLPKEQLKLSESLYDGMD